MEPHTIPDYWIDDAGGGSDCELRCALESFCDVAPLAAESGFKEVHGNGCGREQIGSMKRVRDEACCGSKSKACREKMRRDRLNDRFLELSSVLDPGRPSKTDKASILSDAVRVLAQLKGEAEQLEEANEKLQETIKQLKVEKNELREEKLGLKLDKEKLEQQLKVTSIPPAGFMPPSIALPPAASPAILAAHGQAPAQKALPFNTFPSLAMWQWLPPAFLDTTQDPKLWPPHA
ncbi:transcription factor ILR3-like [Phalaenopsis equestris]|uniref:transcription factor ILR3-like n=1 Tax=Phalaenopsis equestris TaxID=78828 RepID=UPI0009E3AF26|nr:transcription factor ILR3-like [Phalaenopsis equestris]